VKLPKKEFINYYAREFYWDSGLLQQSYSLWQRLRARAASNLYDRLRYICNSARRIRSPRSKAMRMEALKILMAQEFAKHPPKTLADNPFIKAFYASREGRETAATVATWSREKREQLAGNVIVLKSPQPNEKGVLLVHFIPHFHTFLTAFDIAKVEKLFRIVLAPSWYLYPLPYWAMFSATDDPPLVDCFDNEVATSMRACGVHMVPVAIGPQDWVDANVFKPLPGVNKDFDVVMVASFQRLKRHRVLFDALRKIRPRRLKVALIGATWERTREEFDQEIASYGVQDDCTVFQGLSSAQVNEVLNRSKVKVLLSKMEGGNRAVMEALAANTPCLIYEGLIGRRDLTPMSGMYTSDRDLPEKLLYMVDHHAQFRARECFLSRSGVAKATAELNAALKSRAQAMGEPWTRDIVGKLHTYTGLGYLSEADAALNQSGRDALRRCLWEPTTHAATAQ
jgi:glycosyltransferase involved in cell wall biosynthesis